MVNCLPRIQRVRYLPGLLFGTLLFGYSTLASGEDWPQRAADTGYGVALYEYHQGNAFAALTRLNLANSGDGIAGHGDHPLLVEGGLMLAYGMTREARKLFNELLAESDVSPETRNQAWFYLGKVFWLERDFEAASDGLGRVDGELLEESDEALFHEWVYLRGQLALSADPARGAAVQEALDQLPPTSPWRWYLEYNSAVQRLSEGQAEKAIDDLQSLLNDETELEGLSEEANAERGALEQQARLTLGRLYLGQDRFDAAMKVLADIPLNGMLSDQALYDYAVAASRLEQHGLALQALKTLEGRPLFTPWLQQIPYARAFTLEQMGRRADAFEAYRQASARYAELDRQLAAEQQGLTEERLISALHFLREGIEAGSEPATQPALGQAAMLTDAYGRVRVRPQNFSLAELLAQEPFQLTLRDLHELYRLKRSLGQWRDQLDSFELMLQTRQTRREAQIIQAKTALEEQKADQWISEQQRFRRQIEAASTAEDAAFFMTDEQRQLKAKLDRIEQTLATLPDDESTQSQRRAYRRMRAYFTWQIENDYGINRWAAVSQLRELDDAMSTFIGQREAIEKEMASDASIASFQRRLDLKRDELDRLGSRLSQALGQARDDLMSLVRDELASQRRQVAGYLRASRHAQARLADDLYTQVRSATPEAQNE